MSETIFEGLEKIGKKQNKEQVPPPAETQQKKLNAAKQSKKPQTTSSSKPTHYKTLEEAVKAVRTAHATIRCSSTRTLLLSEVFFLSYPP